MQMHGLRYIEPHADVHYYWLFILDGVDLFFVLSGFLIGGILIRMIAEKEFTSQQLFHFWIRRWFRTLPNYILILLVLLAGYRYAFHDWPEKAIRYFSFTQNFASPHPHFFPEAWSLSVEEWFYLLVPFGLFIVINLTKKKERSSLLWILTVLIAVTFFRLYRTATLNGDWDLNIRKEVFTRLDSIMYGFLGAYLNYYHHRSWEKRKNVLFVAGLLLLFGSRVWAAYHVEYYKYIYISVQSIGTLLLLPKLNSIRTGKGIVFKAITFISVISYSMYLLNYTMVSKIILPKALNILGMTNEKNSFHSMVALSLFWIITIFLSWLLYRLYELPMMNLRNRFKPVLNHEGKKSRRSIKYSSKTGERESGIGN
jgi:peptidoglycan/LPS O-acetylase OafA/YrhL